MANPTAAELVNYIISQGVPYNAALGMVANISAESSFNPAAIGDSGASGGLFQHHADRFAGLRKALGPTWASDWKGQIDYALSEPDTDLFLSASYETPEEATRAFTTQWERPANAEQQARIRVQKHLPRVVETYGYPSGDLATVTEYPGDERGGLMAADTHNMGMFADAIGPSHAAGTQPDQQDGGGIMDKFYGEGSPPPGLLFALSFMMGRNNPQALGGLLQYAMNQGKEQRMTPYQEFQVERYEEERKAKESKAEELQRAADQLAIENGLQPGVMENPRQVIDMINARSQLAHAQRGNVPADIAKFRAWQQMSPEERAQYQQSPWGKGVKETVGGTEGGYTAGKKIPVSIQKDYESLKSTQDLLGELMTLAFGEEDKETGRLIKPGAFSGIKSNYGFGRALAGAEHAVEGLVQPEGSTEAQVYNDMREAFLAHMAGIFGHRGAQSIRDLMQTARGLPHAGGDVPGFIPFAGDGQFLADTEEHALRKFEVLTDMLNTQVRNIEQSYGIERSAPRQDQPEEIYEPKTQEEFSKIPVGATFLNPADGKLYVKERE